MGLMVLIAMAATSDNISLDKTTQITCENVRNFKDTMKNLRSLDDKIIYKLNVSVPTESFQHEVDAEEKCRSLYKQLLDIYKFREDSIKQCISKKTKIIEDLRSQLAKNENDFNIQKELRSQQNALRLIQSELMVEEVVKSRSVRVFKE